MSVYAAPFLLAALLAWGFHDDIRAWWRSRRRAGGAPVCKAPPASPRARRAAGGRR